MTTPWTESTTCGICGRSLSDPKSVKRGIGPKCEAKLQKNNTLDSYKAFLHKAAVPTEVTSIGNILTWSPFDLDEKEPEK